MTKAEFINRVLLIMNEAGLYDNQGAQFIGADSAQVDRYIEGSYVDAWRRCAQVMPKAWFKNESFKMYPKVSDLPDGTGFVILPSDFYLMNTFKMTGWRKSALDAYIDNEKVESIQSNEYTRGSQIRPVVVIKTKETNLSETDIIIATTAARTVHEQANVKYFYSGKIYTHTNGTTWKGTWSGATEYSSDYIVVYGGKVWVSLADNNTNKTPGVAVEWSELVGATLTSGAIYSSDEGYFTSDGTSLIPIKYNPGINQVLYYYSLQKGLQSHTVEEAIYVPVASPLSEYDDDSDLELDHRLVEPMAYLSASSVFTIFEKPAIAQALEQKVVEMFPAFKSVKGTNVTFKQ
jgi:hypothetical protein